MYDASKKKMLQTKPKKKFFKVELGSFERNFYLLTKVKNWNGYLYPIMKCQLNIMTLFGHMHAIIYLHSLVPSHFYFFFFKQKINRIEILTSQRFIVLTPYTRIAYVYKVSVCRVPNWIFSFVIQVMYPSRVFLSHRLSNIV